MSNRIFKSEHFENFQRFVESLRHEQKKIDLNKFEYAFHWINEGNLFCQVYDESNLSDNEKTRFILRKSNGKKIEMPTKFPPKKFLLGGDENEPLEDESTEFSNAVCLTVDPEYYQAGFTGESNVCIIFEIKQTFKTAHGLYIDETLIGMLDKGLLSLSVGEDGEILYDLVS